MIQKPIALTYSKLLLCDSVRVSGQCHLQSQHINGELKKWWHVRPVAGSFWVMRPKDNHHTHKWYHLMSWCIKQRYSESGNSSSYGHIHSYSQLAESLLTACKPESSKTCGWLSPKANRGIHSLAHMSVARWVCALFRLDVAWLCSQLSGAAGCGL